MSDHDAIGEALGRLAAALGTAPPAEAKIGLSTYLAGASVETAAREAGVTRSRLDQWRKLAQISRSRDEVRSMQRAALDEARLKRHSGRRSHGRSTRPGSSSATEILAGVTLS